MYIGLIVLGLGLIAHILWIVYFFIRIFPRRECPTRRRWIIYRMIYPFVIFTIPIITFFIYRQFPQNEFFWIKLAPDFFFANPLLVSLLLIFVGLIYLFLSMRFMVGIKSFKQLSLSVFTPVLIYAVTLFILFFPGTDMFHYWFGSPLTRLEISCRNGNTKAIVRLIHSGLNVDTTFEYAGWPLQKAAIYGQYDAVTTLIALGADINKNAEYPQHLFKSALKGGNWKIVDTLMNSTCTTDMNSAFRDAVSFSHKDLATYFLTKKGVDINWVDDDGKTALMKKAASDDLDMVKFLVEHGADIKLRDKYGNTPMLCAAGWGYPHVLKYLLDKGSPIEDKNNQGSTALLFCSEGLSLPLWYTIIQDKYELLLSRGADLNAKDKDGKNVFDKVRTHPQLYDYLLKYKASSDTTSKAHPVK